MKAWQSALLGGLHGIVALGAISGGIAAVINPISPLGAPVEMLKYSPFTTFLIPGLFLTAGVGLVHAMAFWMVITQKRTWFWLSGSAGFILVAWIGIQCFMIHDIVSLHIIFGCIGFIEGIVALRGLLRFYIM